jgi:molybdopterin molybdotransferase
VILPPDLVPGANRRHAGEDIAAGTTVLAAGSRLRPQDIGMAAAVGRASLRVRRRLRIGLLVTGDELRRPGAPLPPGCIYDSNRHTVGAALRSLGAEVSDYGIVPDNRAAIRDALSVAAASNDLVVSTGGMSEGEEDHVRAAVQEIGSLDFWKLPIKPGSPVAIGDAADAAFLGLPGNPVAAMITFWLLGRPLVLHLMGAADLAPARFPVIALFDHQHRPGRREFLRARLRAQAGGRLGAETFGSTGSGMLSSLTWSDGLIELSEDTGDVAAGDIVSYLPYHGLE